MSEFSITCKIFKKCGSSKNKIIFFYHCSLCQLLFWNVKPETDGVDGSLVGSCAALDYSDPRDCVLADIKLAAAWIKSRSQESGLNGSGSSVRVGCPEPAGLRCSCCGGVSRSAGCLRWSQRSEAAARLRPSGGAPHSGGQGPQRPEQTTWGRPGCSGPPPGASSTASAPRWDPVTPSGGGRQAATQFISLWPRDMFVNKHLTCLQEFRFVSDNKHTHEQLKSRLS